jgi:hypothetical protein
MALRRMLIAQRRRSHTEVSASKPVSTAIAAAIMTIAAVGRQVYADDAATAIRPSGELARRIQEELDHEASHERLWWNTSMAAYGGLTVGQGVAAGVSGDYDTRADLGVGAATSFIGVVGAANLPASRDRRRS